MLKKDTLSTQRLLLLLFAALVLLSPIHAAAQDENAPESPAPKRFVAKPDTIQLGRTRAVIITAADDSDLAGLEVDQTKLDNGISVVTEPEVQGKQKLVHIKADDDAVLGNTVLTLKKGEELVGTVLLKITPITRKPTPGGMSQVDVMWSILPSDVVKYNFGSKVAKNFYGIEVVIGNNSGYDLQLTSVGFRGTLGSQPVKDKDGKLVEEAKTYHVPTTNQRLVRGTIERERVYGKRAMVTNFIAGFSPFFAGFTPFYHAANAKANFSSFSSLLNGQFKEGVSLFAPDLTVGQLGRLENQALHDDMIVSNNSQVRTVTFLPKGMINVETGKKEKNLKTTDVMDMLGDIVIVGRQLQFFENREIVVEQTERTRDNEDLRANIAAPTPTPTPTLSSISPKSGFTNELKNVTIAGSNFLNGARVFFGETSVQVRFDSASSLTVTAPKLTAGAVAVKVVNPDGKEAVLANGYTYFEELVVSGADRTSGLAAGDETVKIFGSGFLPGAKVKFDGVELAADKVQVAPDGKSITIRTPAHAAGTARVVVINPDPLYPTPGGKELTGGFTYNPPIQ